MTVPPWSGRTTATTANVGIPTHLEHLLQKRETQKRELVLILLLALVVLLVISIRNEMNLTLQLYNDILGVLKMQNSAVDIVW